MYTSQTSSTCLASEAYNIKKLELMKLDMKMYKVRNEIRTPARGYFIRSFSHDEKMSVIVSQHSCT
jgi:hypothetical protein